MVSLKKVEVFVCPFLGVNLFELFLEEELGDIKPRNIFIPVHTNPVCGLNEEIIDDNSASSLDIEMAINL
ncbi:MAG: hypothetical protein WC011_00040 [Candidatus Paceibacterota bacterium]